jgi:opacity protein-like surface antigen
VEIDTDPTFINPVPPQVPPTISKVIGVFPFSQGQAKSGADLYGFSGGGGLEVGLTQNIFPRGEYEYIQWQQQWRISSSMHNLRLGPGVKF